MRLLTTPFTRLLVGLALAAALVTPAGAAEPQPITFSFTFGNGTCLDGTGLAQSALTISLASEDGQPKASVETTTDANGQWTACLGEVIRGGDVLRARGRAGSRTFAVPRLTAVINRVGDVVRGTAPAGTSVRVWAQNCPGFDSCASSERTVAVGSGGTYSTDFTARFNIVGADEVRVRWTSSAGDELIVLAWTPYLDVWRTSSYFSGAVAPSQPVTIQLRVPDGTLRARGRAVGEWLGGWIEGEFVAAGRTTVHPRVGDRVAADFAKDASLIVPEIHISGSAADDTVSGRCDARDYYRVVASRADASATVSGRSDSAGAFSASFAGRMDLQPGDRLALSCKRATGDMLHLGGRVD